MQVGHSLADHLDVSLSSFVGGRKRVVLLAVCLVLVAGLAFEAYRAFTFYQDVNSGVHSLRSLRDRLDVDQLNRDEALLLQDQSTLQEAKGHLQSARSFVEGDPLLKIASLLPIAGKQVDGATALVRAADESADTGLDAVDLGLAFARYEPDPNKTSIEEAVSFLQSQQAPLAKTRASLDVLESTRQTVPDGLVGPMSKGVNELDNSLGKLDSLVQGYERAQAFLPELLGFDGERRYLLLPENNTELFASGGLISSYGILTVNDGRLESTNLEYFGTLYDRWQKESGGEYIEPPTQLKNYLKHGYSWALGEAGWFPDFHTTAELANEFVSKGGAPSTDGTIAIDMYFVKALLKFMGPIEVPEYGVTVNANNFDEISLQYTRNEYYVPGEPKKAFLSYLAREVIGRLLATPKDRWVDMVSLLDRMGRERHLQLDFSDPKLSALSRDYGFGGTLQSNASDYLLIADTSVNSTKLNLILQTSAQVSVQLTPDGAAESTVQYSVENPFPEWEQGQDPDLVRSLMLDGVYGSYLRIYVPRQAQLQTVDLNGQGAGPEQNDLEYGRAVFGRYFRVLPGEDDVLGFQYRSPGVVFSDGDDYVYSLALRKQAGTDAMPVALNIQLPDGAKLMSATLDGKPVNGTSFQTDLKVDRYIEVRFKLPS